MQTSQISAYWELKFKLGKGLLILFVYIPNYSMNLESFRTDIRDYNTDTDNGSCWNMEIILPLLVSSFLPKGRPPLLPLF